MKKKQQHKGSAEFFIDGHTIQFKYATKSYLDTVVDINADTNPHIEYYNDIITFLKFNIKHITHIIVFCA